MKREISVMLLSLALLTGCGGDKTVDEDRKTTSETGNKLPTYVTNIGKTDGKYNLWDYMTPQTNRVNNFAETKDGKTNEYKTTYKISKNEVIEVSDYAQNEKTIYKKKKDRVIVEFKKDDEYNGSYDLHLTADIGGPVTILTSTCKLTEYFKSKTINSTEFLDVIEIRCNDKPGYYQKDVGEIAQTEVIDSRGVSSLRVLAN